MGTKSAYVRQALREAGSSWRRQIDLACGESAKGDDRFNRGGGDRPATPDCPPRDPGRNISAANWFTLEAIQALSASGAPTGAFQGRVTRWTRMSRGEYDEISVRTGRRRLKSLLAERGEEAA